MIYTSAFFRRWVLSGSLLQRQKHPGRMTGGRPSPSSPKIVVVYSGIFYDMTDVGGQIRQRRRDMVQTIMSSPPMHILSDTLGEDDAST